MEILIIFTSQMLFLHPHIPVEMTYIDITDKEYVILNSFESSISSHFPHILIFFSFPIFNFK